MLKDKLLCGEKYHHTKKYTMGKGAWNRQKWLQKQPIPNINEIRFIAQEIKSDRNRALFVLFYLTGGRVSEIVKKVKKSDLEPVDLEGRKLILIDMPNRKHRARHFKQLPIPIDKEGDLLDMMKPYMDTLSWDDIVFEFSPYWAWKILVKEVGYNCHFMRHIRLTHLVVNYDFNEFLLARFAGWTDGRPAKHYMELRWKDISQKL